jgi:hypothetical protein
LLTAARTNGTSAKWRPPNETDLKTFPQDLMFVPLAPARDGPSAVDVLYWVPV